MKVLITGGAGFIGSHTADALIARGDDVVLLDNLSKPVHLKGIPTYLHPKAKLIIGDVRDPNVFLEALDGVDAVFHLAAYQDYLPDFSTFFSVNAVGTALLYELIVANKLPVKRVVVASSQAVAGEGQYTCSEHGLQAPSARPIEQLERAEWEFTCPECGKTMTWAWTAESFAHPENQYALSKQSQENMTLAFGKRYDIPSVAMRYSIVQGPRQSFYNAYSGACRIFALHYFFKKAPTIYEDGLMHRDFVNYQDVVKANLIALDSDGAVNEVLNVGGGKAYTVREFDRIVAEISGCSDIEPNIPGFFRFGDTRNSASNTDKLQRLGWKAEHSVQDSVTAYVNWLREQKDVGDIFEYAEKNMRSLNVLRETTR